MKEKNLVTEYLLENKNPYKLKIDGITVNMEYSANNKHFKNCILNILKQKSKIV